VEAVETLPRPPHDDPAKWPSLVLSAAVHLLLIGALFLGVQWKSKPPSAVEVEIWRAAPAPKVVSQPEASAGAEARTKACAETGAQA
jgi:colicin import membrane protein